MNLRLKQVLNDIKQFLNQVLGSYKFLLPIFQIKHQLRAKIKDTDPGNLITPQHDVCIVGPPRSANTFTTRVFQYWNPDVAIAHHAHVPSQVLFAAQYNIPCAVLLRHPIDTITSILVANKLSIQMAIFKYTNFFNRIEEVRSQIIILKFEDIINDPNIIVTHLNERYGTSFKATPFTEKIRTEVFSSIRNNPKRTNELLIAIPDQNKEQHKQKIKQSVSNHPNIYKALTVYDKWVQYANTEK